MHKKTLKLFFLKFQATNPVRNPYTTKHFDKLQTFGEVLSVFNTHFQHFPL